MHHKPQTRTNSEKPKMNTVNNLQNDIVPIPEFQHKKRKNTTNIRATLLVNRRQYEKIRDIAYWQRTTIKQVVNLAFSKIIEEHESLNGTMINPASQLKPGING